MMLPTWGSPSCRAGNAEAQWVHTILIIYYDFRLRSLLLGAWLLSGYFRTSHTEKQTTQKASSKREARENLRIVLHYNSRPPKRIRFYFANPLVNAKPLRYSFSLSIWLNQRNAPGLINFVRWGFAECCGGQTTPLPTGHLPIYLGRNFYQSKHLLVRCVRFDRSRCIMMLSSQTS